jgi:hypothetical protein
MLTGAKMETRAMILRILRPTRSAGWVALVTACAVSSACSSNSAPVEETYISATVGDGTNGTLCHLDNQAWLNIGTYETDLPTTQKNGSTLQGNLVKVSCTVATSGNGFDIALSATEEGIDGASVVITSPVGKGAVTQSGGSGITGGFQSGTYGSYQETDCTIAFTYSGAVVPNMPPIAAGRIWGHLSCPQAQQLGMTTRNPDGGAAVPVQCDAEADFLFQECAQ